MALSTQKKIALGTLALYWPVLFISTHISIPRVVREADVSDKSLHFLAYLILSFLLWSVVSGDKKVNWRRVMPWLVLFVIVLYGIFDELLQGYVSGRSSDVRDFIFDLAGVLTGLILSSFLMFWPAGLVITAIFIFGVTNVTRTNLADILPVTNAVFHLLAFAILTVQWIQCLHLFVAGEVHRGRRFILAVAMPTGFMITVTLFSVIAGREFTPSDIIISFGAIMTVVIGFYIQHSVKHSTLQ